MSSADTQKLVGTLSDDDEDEVVFDSSQLARRRSSVVVPRRLTITVWYELTTKYHFSLLDFFFFFCSLCLAFGSLGVSLAMLGPTLIDLAHQTSSTVSRLGVVFSARSSGS